jgi:hypothetical protein
MQGLKLHKRAIGGALVSVAIVAAVFAGNVGTASANFAGLQVCKAADNSNGTVTGSYQFTINAVQSGSPVTIPVTVPVNGCSDAILFDFGSATITETATPTTTLTGISVSPPEDLVSSDLGNRTVTVTLVNYITVVATFTNQNVPTVHGCTLTWGYYKNHGSVVTSVMGGGTILVGADALDAAHVNALLGINENGNNYLIKLVHQLIAAELNSIGASVPASVQTAINAANALIAQQGGASGSATPSTTVTYLGTTYTASGLEGTMDVYNNGNAAGGPRHCAG